jgi:hypothetical protein
MPTGTPNTLGSIYRKVDAIEPDEYGCNVWPRVEKAARVKIEGNQYYVPRLVLERKLGRPIKPGYFACHHCDWPPCVNADHIYEGTKSDNTRDMWERHPERDLFREQFRERMKDPEVREQTRQRMKKMHQNPEVRERYSERMKKQHQDPVFREQFLKRVHSPEWREEKRKMANDRAARQRQEIEERRRWIAVQEARNLGKRNSSP